MDPQAMNQNSPGATMYVVGAIIVVAILGIWYYYSMQPQTAVAPSASEGTQVPLASGDTTADISADLNQLPDDTTGLNQNAAASAEAVGSF